MPAMQIHERLRRRLLASSLFKQERIRHPSVYCDDLYSMFEYMQSVLESHLYVSGAGGERRHLRDALART
jgi:uncharacterized protein